LFLRKLPTTTAYAREVPCSSSSRPSRYGPLNSCEAHPGAGISIGGNGEKEQAHRPHLSPVYPVRCSRVMRPIPKSLGSCSQGRWDCLLALRWARDAGRERRPGSPVVSPVPCSASPVCVRSCCLVTVEEPMADAISSLSENFRTPLLAYKMTADFLLEEP
jgi:hypothetical protein